MSKIINDERVCLYCSKSISHKRSNAKFCDNKCRSRYFNERNKNHKSKIESDLNNVVFATKKTNDGKTQLKSGAIVSKNISKTAHSNTKLLGVLYRNLFKKQQELNVLKQNDSVGVIGNMSQAGSILGRQMIGNDIGEILGSAAFTLFGLSMDTEEIEKKTKENISTLENEITWKKKWIQFLEKDQKKGLFAPIQTNQSGKQLSGTNNGKKERRSNLDKTSSKNSQSKAISIQQLKKIEYQELNFKGRWLFFIGNPAVVFFMIIHGKSGARKSTFAILFANYLAKDFGRVLYISSEEGFAKTFKDKVELLGVNAEDLFVADSKSLENINAELKTSNYNFVFIDSLDTLGIGPQEMKKLRQLHPDIAFITISQSTKDGKMRGSNELIHDSDIVVQVEDGVATTTKNRFLETGKEFEVF